ncbi:type II toxin-antitoxin system HigB family toxin [Candidatus Marithioploca araucensis]|uniref:Type II toxin-antitoxin system HigB family toxin n=1 Tax=Candidatus Marithioploca araucensis TaxID=70273 RepID=A0ABT7VV19_9GAMM|nr:type II toxin-antitoxin system HigB family toxin [Candidatus Marithioploca araucensis]
MKTNNFANFNELRATFPTADQVGNLIVFNIAGNKYRLISQYISIVVKSISAMFLPIVNMIKEPGNNEPHHSRNTKSLGCH